MLGIFFLHQCRLAQQCVLDIYNKCSRWWTFFISLFKKPAELSIDAIIGKWFNVHISSELTCQIRKKTVETHSSRSAPFSRHKNYVFKIVLSCMYLHWTYVWYLQKNLCWTFRPYFCWVIVATTIVPYCA